MLRRLASLMTAVGVLLALTLGAASSMASTIRKSDGHSSHVRLASSPIQFGNAALNPSTGKVVLSGAAHYSEASTASGDDCYVKTEKNRRFKGYKPWHTVSQGDSYFADWLNQLYSVSKARWLTGEGYTFQVQFCTEGGGNTDHGWHQWFDGELMFYRSRPDSKIKWIWGKGASSSGSVSTTLNFSVTKGPVTIGASTTVTPGVGSYEGDFGPDGHFSEFPKRLDKYNRNRINTFFVSPHNWPWDGTSDFEGNTGQVVYEWSMQYSRTHKLYFQDGVQVHGLCTDVLGCSKSW